jgi:hypothetical protein
MTGSAAVHGLVQLEAQFPMDRLAIGILAEQVLQLSEVFDPITSQERADEIVAPRFSEPRRGRGRDNEDGPQRRFLVVGAQQVLCLQRQHFRVVDIHGVGGAKVAVVARRCTDRVCSASENKRT